MAVLRLAAPHPVSASAVTTTNPAIKIFFIILVNIILDNNLWLKPNNFYSGVPRPEGRGKPGRGKIRQSKTRN
jgi:hypothetical protein